MGKLFYLMGKSASGKDTIYARLKEEEEFSFSRLVPYTTRPIRHGEQNGIDYFFTDEAGLEQIRRDGKLIELRTYQTVHGPWHYFTVDDGQIDLNGRDYLLIGTLESYCSLKEYFGEGPLVPLYVEVEDGLRLERALKRERSQETPKYAEMCRRFLADTADFAEEKLKAAGITERFSNVELEDCLEQIRQRIRQERNQSNGGLC